MSNATVDSEAIERATGTAVQWEWEWEWIGHAFGLRHFIEGIMRSLGDLKADGTEGDRVAGTQAMGSSEGRDWKLKQEP